MRKRLSCSTLFFGNTFGAILLLHCIVFAYRPFSTEDAGVGALKENVLETAWELTNNSGSAQHAFVHALVVGLDKAELIFEAPYVLNGDEKGLAEAVIAAKVLLFGSDETTGMFTLKTEFAAPDNSFGLSAVGTKAFGRLCMNCQLGWCNDFAHNSAFYGIAFDYGVVRWMNVVAEVAGGYCRWGHLKPVNCMAGFILAPLEKLFIDIAAGAGLTGDADDFVMTSGLTFVF